MNIVVSIVTPAFKRLHIPDSNYDGYTELLTCGQVSYILIIVHFAVGVRSLSATNAFRCTSRVFSGDKLGC